jgi:hypothetical protein
MTRTALNIRSAAHLLSDHREEGVDGVAPVDAQNASTSRLENPHSTRVSHTAHSHHFLGRKKKIKDNNLSRTRLAIRPGVSNFLTGRLREDLSEGLRNYLRANRARRRAQLQTCSPDGRRQFVVKTLTSRPL